jgi:homocysteine S-methyltransferase
LGTQTRPSCRYGLTVAELAAWHRPRLDVLVNTDPDVLALETVPDVDEALALATVLAGSPVPAWLSYSVSGTCTRAGQPLAEAFAAVADVPEIVAIGVNCCTAADVSPAIATARAVTGKPVVVYPNSGERWDAQRHRWVGPSRFRPVEAAAWVALGAAGVGGCCRVGPDEIAGIVRAVDASSASRPR